MLDIWREVFQLQDFLPTRSKMPFSKPRTVCSKRGLRNAGLSALASPNLSGCSFRLKVGTVAFSPLALPSGAPGCRDPHHSQRGSEKF